MTMVPGGCLTLEAGNVFMAGDQLGKDTLYYSVDPGKRPTVPLFDGSSWGEYEFVSGPSDMVGLSVSCDMRWSTAARDVFVVLYNGAPVLGTNSAGWPTLTSEEAARGIVYYYGLPLNAAEITLDIGPGPGNQLVVPAYQALWVGSIDPSISGVLSCHGPASYGPARKFEIWNAHNAKPRRLMVGYNPPSGEGVGGSSYLAFTCPNTNPNWKPFSDGVVGITYQECSGSVLTGLKRSVRSAYGQGFYRASQGPYPLGIGAGIGWNSISVTSGEVFDLIDDRLCAHSSRGQARYTCPDAIGTNWAIMLYKGYYPAGAGGITVSGSFNRPGDPPETAHLLEMVWEG